MLALAGTAISATANISWWSRHGAHLVLLGVPTLLFAVIGIRADVQARTHRRPRVRDHAVRLACGFSIVAAAVHTAVCPEHFTEATVYGLFFLFAAIAQLAWAVIVWIAPRRGLLVAGAVGNGLVVALWAVSRTVGIPIGPGRGEIESIGALDILATTCEVAVLVCVVTALARRAPRAVTV